MKDFGIEERKQFLIREARQSPMHAKYVWNETRSVKVKERVKFLCPDNMILFALTQG